MFRVQKRASQPIDRTGSVGSDLSKLLCFLVVGGASVSFFFRIQIETRFNIVFGDRGDGLLEIAILEHWWNVLRGISPWRDPIFFFPVRDVLGFNDGYLVYGAIYATFRSFSLDPILASESTNVFIKTVGFVGCFLVLRRDLQRPHGIALLGASVFVLSDDTYVNAYHAQLLSVSFVPWLALVSYRFGMAINVERGVAIMAWGIASSCLVAIWLLTAFYMIWFTLLLGMITVVIFITRLPSAAFRSHAFVFWRQVVPIGLSAAFGLIALIPFLLVYFRTSMETGMHPFSEALLYTPTPFDILNVGPKNLLFGFFDQRLAAWFGGGFPLVGELVMGIPPTLLVLAATGTLLCARRDDTESRWLFALASAAILSWLLTLRVGNWSAWKLVFEFIPGAKAIRVVSRYDIVLMFPAVLLATEVLTRFWNYTRERDASLARGLSAFGLATTCILLVAEEVNLASPLALDRLEEDRITASISVPPSVCKSFYAVGERLGPPLGTPATDAAYSSNVDAMFIAEVKGIPTLNGMASFYPPGWDLTRPRSKDYPGRIAAWIATHHLMGVCSLDLGTGAWSAPATVERAFGRVSD